MSLPPIAARTLLFDLDGTLADTAPDIAAATNRTLQVLGLSPRLLSDLRQWIGNGSTQLIKRALTGKWDGDPDSLLLRQALITFFDLYADQIWEQSRLFPDVQQTLVQFHDAGLNLSCVTNKPARHTELLLEQSGLSRYLQTWIAGDTLSVRKPDPGPLQYAAELLGSAITECIMIGDSMNDILAAKFAGMSVICLTYGYHQGMNLRSGRPDRILDHFRDLTLHVKPLKLETAEQIENHRLLPRELGIERP